MRRTIFVAALLALLAIGAGPDAWAKKGGGGKPGGGGGEDPAPTCSGHVYTLWQTYGGKASSATGLARVCLEGANGELLTSDGLGWNDRLEVSPDGTHVLHNAWVGGMIDLADPTTVLSFSGESGALPKGSYPSWSWRVDTAGEPLGALDQYVAVSRIDPIDIPEYDTTELSMDVLAFHPVAGATAIPLTSLPRVYTRTEASVEDRDSGEIVAGAIVRIVNTEVRDVTWMAGSAEDPDVSWIVFWQRTTDDTYDVVGDATEYRAWSTTGQQVPVEGWQVMAVKTSSTGVSVLHAPQPLVAVADLASVDVRSLTRNLRVSKFGTHALWEYAENAGMRRAALTYSTTDPSAPPQIDASTIEEIDPALYTDLGDTPFANVGMSHDGSRLAIALGEVWLMDVDTGASSLTQISETIRKRKPGYGVSVAWDQ